MSTMSGRKTTSALPCPMCEHAYTKIKHAVSTEKGYRRRRFCLKCNYSFLTYEKPEEKYNEEKNQIQDDVEKSNTRDGAHLSSLEYTSEPSDRVDLY